MVEVHVASAFSKNNSGGNKAGVVVQDFHLGEKQKMELAKELGYSETAFVLPSKVADYKLEYFTPEEEVPLCGHATVATFVVLRHLGRLKQPSYAIETKAGILNIMVREDGMIFMEQNRPQFDEILDKALVEKCFSVDAIAKDLPIQIVSTGLRDILVPINSPEHLKEMNPDFEAISGISKNKDVIGLHAFSLVNEDGLTAVCRNFAPLYGIDEEAATGTSNCALACYLFLHGRKQKQYVFEQGHNLGAVSRIVVCVESKEDEITKVAVGGYGYLLGKKHL